MRIAVAGDTHGRTEKLTRTMQMLKPDHLFFTGDFYNDGLKLARRLNIDWTGVTGNCDFGPKGRQEQLVTYAGRSFYLIHGHQYGAKRSLNSLFYRGQEVGANVVLFGHTHVPVCERMDGIWMINPGSASLPRHGSSCSYALIDLGEKVDIDA
ncbi:metallophosphoesterase family protein [Syntrophomonas curvata]